MQCCPELEERGRILVVPRRQGSKAPISDTTNSFFVNRDQEISKFSDKFRSYVVEIDKFAVRAWLSQFRGEHRELGLKLLGNVDYYSPGRVMNGTRVLHEQLMAIKRGKIDRTLFASMALSPGSGADMLLPAYRVANRLKKKTWDSYFIRLSELGNFFEQKDVTFAFIDDFIGTGNHVITMWQNIGHLVPEDSEALLLVLTGYKEGIDAVERNTRLEVVCNKVLSEENKVFSSSNPMFDEEEKRILKSYCETAGSLPEGYGCMQSTVIFYYRAPNNTISILRCISPSWKGLFPRNP